MLARPDPADRTSAAACRVMVVDDSAVVRGMLTRLLEGHPEFAVVASAGNGESAVSTLRRHEIDVILLDIDMPVMDGLTAIPLLLEQRPGVKIVIVSTLMVENPDCATEAMRRGAHDFIAKPSSARELTGEGGFAGELLRKLNAVIGGEPATAGATPPQRRQPQPVLVDGPPNAAGDTSTIRAPRTFVLRKAPVVHPSAIAIGSSTGGPKALTEIFSTVDRDFMLPIFITQHMPPTFTAMLAQHLAKASGRVCEEGVDGMDVVPGNIYLAPGGYHMTVQGKPGAAKIALNQEPPENFCRPAVDPMLRSVAAVYGTNVLVVILTGMGSDGQLGCAPLAAGGATVIAQDEATSTVWGMPGAVAMAGLCNEVLSLSEIGTRISQIAIGKRP
jgi:two-component system chemotaxis response regulator CheB